MRVLELPVTLLPCPHLLNFRQRPPPRSHLFHHQQNADRSHAGHSGGPQHRKRARQARLTASAQSSSDTTAAGPSASQISIRVGEHEVTLESGEIGRQAGGAVLLRTGGTVIYTTACTGDVAGDGSFVPLQVSYSERFSAAGRISGGWLKREGRPRDTDILTSRLIDRPLRPMIPKGFSNDTQVLSFTMSYDGIHTPEPHAITAASAAMLLSDIPFAEAVAGVRVGLLPDGQVVVNPTVTQMARSRLDLIMAGTQDKLLMVEGFCDFLTDKQMQEAVHKGMVEVSKICKALTAWAGSIGKPVREWAPLLQTPSLQDAAKNNITEELRKVYLHGRGRHERRAAVHEVRLSAKAQLAEQGVLSLDEDAGSSSDSDSTTASTSGAVTTDSHVLQLAQFQRAFHKIEVDVVRQLAQGGQRADGRDLTTVRPISSRAGLLPCTHGSALFTRGETQSLAVATLGSTSAAQMVDNMQVSQVAQRFQLQYFFPQSSVGETGRAGFASRREIGHGHLAERSILPVIPSLDEFPYVVRLESTITESNGSSSMASVCSACLALRDAGVPLKRNVAGVAMGLILQPSGEFTVLTDILGSEDAFGDMDFKVAGDADGITAFQLDVKAQGIPVAVLDAALPAATQARRHVLERMQACSPAPSGELGEHVPRIARVVVPISRLGNVIGPGGRTARGIQEQTGATSIEIIDQDTGTFEIVGPSAKSVQDAKQIITNMTAEPEPGRTYADVPVAGIEKFGLFVEFLPSQQGLVHVSELMKPAEDYSIGDRVDVKLLEVNDGRMKLSIKALHADAYGVVPESPAQAPVSEPLPPLAEGDVIRDCPIRHITSFGVFVECGTGRGQGLVHVSQLALERVENPEDLFKLGDKIDVQVMPPRRDGKTALSRKAVLTADARA